MDQQSLLARCQPERDAEWEEQAKPVEQALDRTGSRREIVEVAIGATGDRIMAQLLGVTAQDMRAWRRWRNRPLADVPVSLRKLLGGG